MRRWLRENRGIRQIVAGVKNATPRRIFYPPETPRFSDGPSTAKPKPEVKNLMAFEAFSFLGATISLECTVLLLGAALLLDFRRAERQRWFRGHLQRILQGNPRPALVDMADAA